VIITTYNRANLITRTIDSLISQSEKDWEAIIVDDGSTDETFSHIGQYLKFYSEIRYIKQSHKGFVAAKNTGLKSASGRFITFLDSDDEFDPIHLESRKLFLIQNPSVKFLYGGVKVIGDQYVPDRFNPAKKVNLDECIIGGTFFIERNTANYLNGFRDLPLGDDADLFDRAKAAGVPAMKVYHPTYIYHRETDDSVTNRLLRSY
jgi:glycosyltransferase involved in cell wall biosynthesis